MTILTMGGETAPVDKTTYGREVYASRVLMETHETLILEKRRKVGIIIFNRPKVLNAMNRQAFVELETGLCEAENDEDLRVIILTGQGEKAFVAGTDILEMHQLTSSQARDFALRAKGAIDRIENLGKPVIAAVNGVALGGGCEIALACDLRIASENARFGLPEITLGIIPGSGGTQRLQRLIRISRAKEMIFTGEVIDAETAFRIGLVNRIVSAESLMEEAERLAERMTGLGGVALEMAKAAINQGASMDLGKALHYEIECFSQCFATNDQKEGMAAFLEKRKPRFQGN